MANAIDARIFVPAEVLTVVTSKSRGETVLKSGSVMVGDKLLTFYAADAVSGTNRPSTGDRILVHLGAGDDGHSIIIDAWKSIE